MRKAPSRQSLEFPPSTGGLANMNVSAWEISSGLAVFEREEYRPSLVLALRISKVLNAPVSDLFSLAPLKKGK